MKYIFVLIVAVAVIGVVASTLYLLNINTDIFQYEHLPKIGTIIEKLISYESYVYIVNYFKYMNQTHKNCWYGLTLFCGGILLILSLPTPE